MKQAKSYREFNRICRKYWKRHWKRRSPSGIDIYVYYDFMTIDDVKEALTHTKWCKGNLRLILNEFLEMKDMLVFIDNDVYILRGVQETNEDIYWILETAEGNRIYGSCLSHIDAWSEALTKNACEYPDKSDSEKFDNIIGHAKMFIEKLKENPELLRFKPERK